MKIYQGNIWCKVEGIQSELEWLHNRFTITTQGFNRGRVHIEKRYLYNARTRRFPAGLLTNAVKYAEAEGVELQCFDVREKPAISKKLPSFYGTLFGYQKEAIDAAIKGVNGIIKLPTGAGKTFLAIGLASRMKGKTLFLVDDRGLIEQTKREWTKLVGTEAGTIHGAKFDLKQFTVAMTQTLNSKMLRDPKGVEEMLRQFVCLIVDEAHGLGAKTKYNVAMRIPSYWRIGLSATPGGRSDKRDAYVVGALGPVLYTMPIQELVDMGRLAKARVVFYHYPGQSEESVRIRQWAKLYREHIVRNKARNSAIVRVCLVAQKPTLLFFIQIRHGKHLLELCRGVGLKAEIVHGACDGASRMRLAKRLGNGEIDVLLASTVFFKGVDIPEIRSAINAAGYKAKIPSIQKVGRAMRVSEGKKTFSYWDLYDVHRRSNRYGEVSYGSLELHSKMRARTYKESGLETAKFDVLKSAVQWLREI